MKYPFTICGIIIWDNEIQILKEIGFFRWSEHKLNWRKFDATNER